ncbi:hypothetical protein GA0070606_0899 [Micromonospora citrea]|uniref:Uncharacterized protein n=1 Tax=Micromonospora citrea TaxID=47855 RepID=A0A1C6TWL9_9ACTN|nr:hypothetical protein [Micromonospora citrea]SCL45991.1 hypothetical protein GA0070606_0899 [Micromonospora citrea]
MDDLSAAGLAAAASAALIQAMASDVWLNVKDHAARIFGRDESESVARAERVLEDSRDRLYAAAPDRMDEASALEAARWEGRLQARLEDDPSFAIAVRELVAAVRAAGEDVGQSTTVQQNVTAGRDAYTAGRDLTVGRPDRAP